MSTGISGSRVEDVAVSFLSGLGGNTIKSASLLYKILASTFKNLPSTIPYSFAKMEYIQRIFKLLPELFGGSNVFPLDLIVNVCAVPHRSLSFTFIPSFLSVGIKVILASLHGPYGFLPVSPMTSL